MSTSEIKIVKKSQKRRTCFWCWEPILVGCSYHHYFCFESVATINMHPECMEAMKCADLQGELPTAGTFARGCCCGDNIEVCKCVTRLMEQGK